jgi:hypothetical protein
MVLGRSQETKTVKEASPDQKNKPLEPLHKDDEQLIRIAATLNKSKTRIIDLFRSLDKSGDGLLSASELRAGLKRIGLELTKEEFAVLLSRVDQDGSGELEARELDKALKLVEKKARNEGRAQDVDTWAWQLKRKKSPQFDWSKRTLTIDGSPRARTPISARGDSQLPSPQSQHWSPQWSPSPQTQDGSQSARHGNSLSQQPGLGASVAFSEALQMPSIGGSYSGMVRRPASDLAATKWSPASTGPGGRATASRVGCGNMLDKSVYRQKVSDVHASPGARPTPTMLQLLPLHKHSCQQAMFPGRFGFEPCVLPSSKMLDTAINCAEALRGNKKVDPRGGVKKFHNSPMMQSTVDQVVFNRDLDDSGTSKFDEEFTQMFNDCRGLASWHVSGR